MAYIERNGVKVYFEDHGAGPCVLLTHAFGAASTMWREQVLALEAHYRVIIWDMRGHGRSDYPKDPEMYSESQSVGDMVAMLDACGLEGAVVGGLSLGGCTSLAFQMHHPERTNGLMLFDTGPGFKNDAARDTWNIAAEVRASNFEKMGLGALADTKALKISGHRNANGLMHAARGMLTQSDNKLINHLPNISVPTLVVVGSEDLKFHAATEYMAHKIPAAHKILIKDAGHEANMDQPAMFNLAIKDFLRNLCLPENSEPLDKNF